MSSISQGLVLATAVVISSTALFLGYCRQKSLSPTQVSGIQSSQQPQKQILRSCICSEERKKERKKKRVQFAANVKEPRGDGKEYRKERFKPSKAEISCRNEIRETRGMPENRIALYNGILKDRVQRMQCSY